MYNTIVALRFLVSTALNIYSLGILLGPTTKFQLLDNSEFSSVERVYEENLTTVLQFKADDINVDLGFNELVF